MADNSAVAQDMVGQSRRTLDIASRTLDPGLYNTSAFAQAVRNLALHSRNSRIRLLVRDTTALVSHGHRLIELTQALSSFISVRRLAPEHREFNEAWLIADNTGYMRRPSADRYEGNADFADRRHAEELTRRFEAMWDCAEADPNLKRLHL